MYMMPIFLWSTLVSQSRHSGFHQCMTVSKTTTPIAPRITILPAPDATNSLVEGCLMAPANTSESQLSCPKIVSQLTVLPLLFWCVEGAVHALVMAGR